MSQPKFKHTGEFLVGFGLLFFGLSELKNAVPDVKAIKEFGSRRSTTCSRHSGFC